MGFYKTLSNPGYSIYKLFVSQEEHNQGASGDLVCCLSKVRSFQLCFYQC